MRRMTGGWRDDAGMTLLEILSATVILFIALTGVLGLVAASTRMGVQSRQSVITVHQVQSYIEGARRVDYDDLGVTGGANGSIEGTLSAETTYTANGYRVVIRPTVTWVDDPNIAGVMDYKRLRIVAESQPVAGGTVYSYTAETFIRLGDAAQDGSGEEAIPPVVEFAAGSPTAMEVVWGVDTIYANAWSPMPNGVLAHLRFYCDGRELRDSMGNPAEWALAVPSVTGQAFDWDTEHVDEDLVPLSPDGIRTLRIETWDNLGQQSFLVRQVVVDNSTPRVPDPAVADPRSDTLTTLTWPIALDGTDPADSYQLYLRTQGASTYDYWEWPLDTFGVTGTSYDKTTAAFSRYRVRLRAVGPPPAYRTSDLSAPTFWISRSRLSGTWRNVYSGNGANRACTTTVNMSLSAPTFPHLSMTSRLYRSLSPDMSGAVELASGGALAYTDTFTTTVGSKGSPTPYYYQLRTEIQPDGAPNWGGNAVETVASNVLGPNGAADNGVMPNARW